MPRKLQTIHALTLWHGGNDLPPATAKKQPKPKKIIDLAEKLQRAYSRDARRIA